VKHISLILNAVLLVAVIYLYYLHYSNNSTEVTVNSDLKDTSSVSQSIIAKNVPDEAIVYFNTDSLWKNYEYVKDMENALIAEKQRMENKYNQQIKALEAEYKEFQRKTQAMEYSMEDGKKKQQELMKKEQNIYKLEDELNQKYTESEAKKTREIQKEILDYLKRYNKEKGYTYILGKTFGNIPYANEDLDITRSLLDGLNAEYKEKQNSANAK